MKTLNNFINEALIGKTNKIDTNYNIIIDKFQKYWNIDNYEDAQWIWNNYIDESSEHVQKIVSDMMLNKFITKEYSVYYYSPFKLLFMLVVLLVTEPAEWSNYIDLGTDELDNNPYDYDLFAETCDRGRTLLEYVKTWIYKNQEEFKKIYTYIDNIEPPFDKKLTSITKLNNFNIEKFIKNN